MHFEYFTLIAFLAGASDKVCFGASYNQGMSKDPWGILDSSHRFSNWATKEFQLQQVLRERCHDLEKERFHVALQLKHFQKEKHPVLQYEIICTFFNQLTKVWNARYAALTTAINAKSALQIKAGKVTQHHWISSHDHTLSINALLNIHHHYSIRLTNGFRVESNYGGHLLNKQYLDIGIFALFTGMYYRAVEWLDIAANIKRLKPDNIKEICSQDLANSLQRLSIQGHNRAFKQQDVHKEFASLLNLYSGPIKHIGIGNTISRKPKRTSWRIHKILYPPKIYNSIGYKFRDAQFRDLCRGMTIKPTVQRKYLKCYYEQKRHPYLYINPVKVEHLSQKPPIFQLYQVIGPKTTQLIKNFRLKHVGLNMSSTFARVTMKNIQRNVPAFGVISEIVTGLKILGSSEPIQIVEYVFGRMLEIHSDKITIKSIDDWLSVHKEGVRLATSMYYLESPEYGGETPFCEAGVFARPEKGSAVVWFNSYKNGSIRNDVHHGACPVLHGNKIVFLTAIRYYGNWKNHPCTLDQME